MELSTIKTQTTWAAAVETINSNNNKIAVAIQSAIINSTNSKHKGYFSSASVLPSGEEGAIAFVGEWPNYKVYYWSNGSWYNSGQEAYLQDYVSSTGDSAIVGSLTVTEGVRSYKFIVAKNAYEDYGDGYVILAGGGVKPVDDFVPKKGNSTIEGNISITNGGLGISNAQTIINNGVITTKFGVVSNTASELSVFLTNGTFKSVSSLGTLQSAAISDNEDYEEVF